MDRAALPGAGEDASDRRLEACVLVGDAEPDTLEAALAQRAQEGDPEGLGLDLADVEADHLAPARLMHRVGDHERLRIDVAAISDLDHLGVEPEVGVLVLERSIAKRLDLLVERILAVTRAADAARPSTQALVAAVRNAAAALPR